MGIIFGSDGDKYNKQGGYTFYSGANGQTDNIYHADETTYGNNGKMFNTGGRSSFGDGNIYQSGNMYESNGQKYYRSGNVLFGPNGQRWHGDMDDGDIRDIISHNGF